MDPKKVMVGGMPYYITEDDIHEFFKECGTIAELDCMTFPDTGKFKGIAFITFRVSTIDVHHLLRSCLNGVVSKLLTVIICP